MFKLKSLKQIGVGTAMLMGSALSYLGARNANKQNQLNMDRSYENPLGPRIEDGKKYGIHPLAAIGATGGYSPTIPMQNELAGVGQMTNMLAQNQQKTSIIDEQLKQYALTEAKQRQHDRQYEYELLIPVKHKDYPEKTMWAFNSKYLAYGTFPTLVTMAANKETALNLLKQSLTGAEKQKLEQTQKYLEMQKLSPLHREFIQEGGANTYRGKIRR